MIQHAYRVPSGNVYSNTLDITHVVYNPRTHPSSPVTVTYGIWEVLGCKYFKSLGNCIMCRKLIFVLTRKSSKFLFIHYRMLPGVGRMSSTCTPSLSCERAPGESCRRSLQQRGLPPTAGCCPHRSCRCMADCARYALLRSRSISYTRSACCQPPCV